MACRLMVLLLLSLCVFALTGAQMKKKMKSNKKRMGAIVKDLEQNISAIWQEVDMLSQPVHVHIHGDGHLMDHHDYDDDYHVHDHDDHDHDHDHHDHEHMEHEMHETDHMDHEDHHEKDHKHDHNDEKHDHKDHKRWHKKHHKDSHKDEHKHEDEDRKHDHHDEDKMKKMKGCNCKNGMMKEMMGGRGHGGHSHMHDGHHGTHVHIHLHTAMEEEMEMKQHLIPPPTPEYRYARCDVVGNSALSFRERQDIEGPIFLRQMPGQPLEVEVNLKGFTIDHRKERDHQHLRGVHGHEFGDLSDGCNSMGGHYNPHGVHHGSPQADVRHPGDWGNLKVKEDGSVMTSFNDTDASLFGPQTLLGRGIVIHAGTDDHGLGEDTGSKSSGNAGARIACCAIVACPEPKGVWSN